MVGEIANFVAKHKAKLFPEGGSKKTSKSERPGSVGDLGKSLKDNDPETLKFIGRHKTTIYGDKPEVATKHCLDDPINSHMKPKEGVYEDSIEEEDMEEAAKCPKCGAENCTCQHEECGSGKKLKVGKKLKEETLSNLIALDVLEDMKSYRLDEQEIATRRQAKDVANKAYDASRPTKRSFVDKVMGRSEQPEAHVKSFHRDTGRKAVKKFYDLKQEGVDNSVHKVSPGDPDYTGGMHVHTKPKAEVATGHKPTVSSSEKSKKLPRKEVKEGHKDPMPHLDNLSHGSGCTGHEDSMIHVKKAQADPTKIPNMNKVPNSTQPKSGVLDRKKKKITEADIYNKVDTAGGQKGVTIGPKGFGSKSNRTSETADMFVSDSSNKIPVSNPQTGKSSTVNVQNPQTGSGEPKFSGVGGGPASYESGKKKKISEGFNRVSDPFLRKQAIGKANKLDAPPASSPPKTGTSKSDLMTSLSAIRKKQMEETELEEAGKEKVEKTMHEFKHGTLHSGSKTGPKVKNRRQAIAIALSQQRKADGK